MSDRQLRRRCERRLSDVSQDLPDPFDVHEFCRRLGARRGRPIHLLPMPLPPDRCGMWAPTATYDAIFFEQDTSRSHQDHIISHELAHLLCGHTPAVTIDAGAFGSLFPDLDPALLVRTLGRSNYSETDEREAEMVATLLLSRAHRRTADHLDPNGPADAALDARLRSSLEHPDR